MRQFTWTGTLLAAALSLSAACFLPTAAADESDAAAQLLAVESPESWSGKLHMMIHVGPYTLDMTGDLTTHGKLVKSRLLSGAGGNMIFVKVYTGADGIQWTELSSPPRRKEVVTLDLNQLQEATGGTLGLNLLERLDGSSTLGINMGDVWRDMLDRFGDDATVARKTVEGEEVFEVRLLFSEDTYDLIDPSGSLREEEVKPTVMVLHVGAEDGLLRYMALLTTEPMFRFELLLKDIEIDPEVDLSDFEYTPPDGIEPKDVTAEAIAEITGEPLEDEVEDFRLIY